jgi:uncharacterized OsmC-like protein
MDINISYLGGVQFEAETRGHKLYCDQPAENHGFDEGMTPPELLLAAVGTCAGYYAAEYLNRHKLPAAALRVRVSAEKATNPARLARFAIVVETPGVEDPEQLEGVKRAVDKCLIKNTLLNTPEIAVTVAAGPLPRGGDCVSGPRP